MWSRLPRLPGGLAAIPPGSWAIVMGCGIVSIDLDAAGQPILSAALLWFAVATWIVLAVRAAGDLDRLASESRSAAVLGGVAGPAVLGTRFAEAGARLLAAVLLVLATGCLAVLLVPVTRHWVRPVAGTYFLVTVAAQGLAVLSATLAAGLRLRWLLAAAIAVSLAGLVSYPVIAWQFDRREIGAGAGDQWVAGGALAISALAAGKITASAAVLSEFTGWHAGLADASLALWCASMAWLVVLIAGEIGRPRPRYDVRRWATVFPVGMYAACGFAVGQVAGIGGITWFAKGWTWVACGVTLAALVGLTRRAWASLRSPGAI
jgi:Voltage-dependent anion channel